MLQLAYTPVRRKIDVNQTFGVEIENAAAALESVDGYPFANRDFLNNLHLQTIPRLKVN
jgi:hypothetical protein